MAFLTEDEAKIIRNKMLSNENSDNILNIKYKAKKKEYIERTVSLGEIDDYYKEGYELVSESKRKARIRKKKDFNIQFEDDIWCLFYKLGFRILNEDETLSIRWGDNPSDRQQLDVVAVGEDAIFVVECKAAETPKNRNFKEEINKIERYKDGITKALRQIYGDSKKVKFIFATRNYRISEDSEDQKRLKEKKIFHLNDNTYNYLSNLIKSYKETVIYQFYGLMFKDEIINNERITIPAIKGSMGGRIYYLFSIEPYTLLKIGFVLHRTRVNDSYAPTYQRLLIPSRLKAITKFIDSGRYFPNSVIVNFSGTNNKLSIQFAPIDKSPDTKAKLGMLYIPNAYGLAYIIDGQHRIYGYANSKYLRNNTIPVVAFNNMESEEQLKIFMEINENQKSVSPSLRLDLNEDINWKSEQLDSRMKALRSSIIKRLASSENNVLYNKISIGEDTAELAFKPFDTALSQSELIPKATKTRWTGDTNIGMYDIRESSREKAMEDAKKNISKFINGIYEIVDSRMVDSMKQHFLFSNRATFPLITLIGSLHAFCIKNEKINTNSKISDRIEALKPYFEVLVNEINCISDEKLGELTKSLGQGADTLWLRTYQDIIHKHFEDYAPEEYKQWKETKNETLQEEGRKLIQENKELFKQLLFAKLESSYGDNWENSQFISIIKNECEGRILKEMDEYDNKTFEDYDWKDYLEIINYKNILKKISANSNGEQIFSIELDEGNKSRSNKWNWLSYLNDKRSNRGLTQSDINNLNKIHEHLESFSNLL